MTDRARVPFALIGVLLLVASGTLALSLQDPIASEPAVDVGMDRLTAEAHTALRAAVLEAANEAARRPVVEPANSTVGRALNDSRPFEDALRLRIYVEAREHLTRLANRRQGVALAASLPPIRDAADVRAAVERVHMARAGPDGRALSVRIDGLALRARTERGIVGERRLEPTIVVETPVLAVHDRVEGFEQRLNAPVGEPGLATRLSAVLYPIAWARGYAQFRGKPVENVVANRHVALVTNGAVLAEQRAAFGASDHVGRAVYRRTLAETAVTDLVAGTNSSTLERLDRLRGAVGLAESSNETLARLEPAGGAVDPSATTTVRIGRAADRAYLRAVDSLNETVDATYTPAGRVRANVRTVSRRVLDRHRPPVVASGPVGSWTTRTTTVRNRTGTTPPAADGWHELAGFSRTVVVNVTTVREWSLPMNRTTHTRGTVRKVKAVGVIVEGDHVVGPAPPGPIASVHEVGGPFDGPNLVDAPTALRTRLVAHRGGPDALAANAAVGRLDTDPVHVRAPRSDRIAAWARPDLLALRERIRRIAVEVERGEVATFRANVPALLADRLRERRAGLIEAPATYRSVAHRARVGVRADYVDRVVATLEAHADQHRTGRSRFREAVPTAGETGRVVRAGYRARGADGPGPRVGLRTTVDASPSYLTVQAVDHETVPVIPAGRSEHPLVVRNLNAFSLPTADVVTWLFGLLDGPKTASLRSAARVLDVAEGSTGDRIARATRLRSEVDDSNDKVARLLRSVLARRDLGTPSTRAEVVTEALERWDGAAARAEAIVNGSAAEAVHAAALERWPGNLATAHERTRLAIALDFAVVRARDEAFFQPTERTVNGTATRVRARLGSIDDAVLEGARRLADSAASDLGDAAAARLASRLPRGVPVVPSPGLWYAMVNAWHVQARGSYARFVVRVPTGAPDRMPPGLSYVRETATVRLDVDADGDSERVGYNRRVTFAAETVVAVAVPPQPQGVGDVTERDERSPGWPTPVPEK